MRIIKLEIEVPTKNRRVKVIKQAVSLDRQLYKNIDHFLTNVKKICSLSANYSIDIDGFAIAPHDTVNILQENRVYRLKIVKNKATTLKQVVQQSSSDSSSFQSQEQICGSESSEESDSSSPQKIQKAKQIANKKKEKKSKVEEKHIKSNKKPAVKSQSNESQQSEQTPIKKVKVAKVDQKAINKKDTLVKLPTKSNKIQKKEENFSKPLQPSAKKQPIKKPSSSSSESQQSEEVPTLLAGSNKLDQTNHKAFGKQDILPKPFQGKSQHKKAVIHDSSESQSSSSPQKAPQPKQIQKQTGPTFQKCQTAVKSPQNIKFPPALRNKMVAPKPFQKHKQNQWLPLDKQRLKKWQQKGHKYFCQVPNKIRFKIIQFDEQKFIPVKSGWILGQVSSVSQKGVVNLINVDQQGKEFKKSFEIPQHNMDELQIWRLLATQQQLECLEQSNEAKEISITQKTPAEPQPAEPRDSVQKFICGQVNYYFSDRNYFTDFFIQLHTNSHPQKYLKLSFLLNFPKIKKVLKNEEKLTQYLREDQKYETRNYQIDFRQGLIRKKHIESMTPQAGLIQHQQQAISYAKPGQKEQQGEILSNPSQKE